MPAPIYSAGVASVGPMLPSHSQSRAHSLSHPPILPHGSAPLLPSISSSGLPPPPYSQQSQNVNVSKKVTQPDEFIKKNKRKYTNKKDTASENSKNIPKTASVKEGKKRGKYKKRNKSGDASINSVIDNDISGSITGGENGNRMFEKGCEGSRIVHHDENSMYLADFQIFSSPQSHTNTNMHNRLLSEDSRPPEISFDGFSQISFDWENSHGGASNGTPSREKFKDNTNSMSAMLNTIKECGTTGNKKSTGDDNKSNHGSNILSDGEFSNLIHPGDDFSFINMK